MIRIGGDANSQEQKPDWNLSSLGMNFASGYLEGLTTFDILKEESPDTTPEYIARSLGSVLGFIGWLPTPGAFARIGLAGASHTMQLLGNASRAEKLLTSSKEIATLGGWLTGKIGGSSIPTVVGSIGSRGIERFFETSAAGETMRFAEKLMGRTLQQETKEFTRNIISQSVFMGFASAAGARPISFNPLEYFSAEDFKTRSSAFLEGLPFGAVQGGIASAITAKTIGKMGFESLAKMPLEKQEFILKSMRAVATGVTMAGWTAYKNDVPIEYTVYEGLLNGVFGYREMPYQMREAHRITNKHLPNQGVIHGDLMMKSGGDLVAFARSKGENPSEGVQAELKLIQTQHFNAMLAKGAILDANNYQAARMAGESEETIANMTPLDRAALIGRPEFEQFHLLTTDIAKIHFDDEMSKREKEFTERVGRIPTDEERTQLQEGVFPLVQKIVSELAPSLAEEVRRTANRVQQVVTSNITIVEKHQEILNSLNETGVSKQQMGKITQAFPQEILEGRELELVSTIGKVFSEHRKADQKQYKFVKEGIERDLGKPFTPEQNQKVNILWNMYANTKIADELVYTEDGRLTSKPGYNRAGIEQRKVRDHANYEKILGIDLTEITEVNGNFGRNNTNMTKGIFEQSKSYEGGEVKFHSINFNKFIHTIYEHGKLFIGNDKDDHRVFAEPRGTTEFDSETNSYTFTHEGITYRTGIQEGFNQIDQAEGRTIGESYATHIAERTKYVEDNTGKSYEKAKDDYSHVQYLEKAYDEMAGNLMVKWLALNKKTNNYELFSSPNTTIRNAVSRNKRNQIVFGGGIPMDATVVGRETHKGVRIHFNNNGMENVFGEALRGQEDGSTVHSSRVNADIVKTLGTSEKITFYKTAIAASLSTGLQINKEGSHRATTLHEQRLNEMLGNDWDYVRNDSSLKQAGDIPTIFVDVSPEGKYIAKDALGNLLTPEQIEKMKYDIPVSSIRLNPSVTEDVEMGDVHYLKQFFSNMPDLRDHLMATVVEPSLNGKEEVNKAFDQLKTGQEIDIDKVSVKKILDVMYGKDFHKAGPKVIAVVDKLFKYILNKGDIIEGEDEGQLVKYLEKLRGTVELSLAATGKDNITASFLREKPVRDYLEQALHRYISDRGQRPVYDGFASSSRSFYGLTPADVIHYEKTSGRKFSQGDIFLGKGLREMVREVPKELKELFPDKKTISLGELWDMYQKRKETSESMKGGLFEKLKSIIPHEILETGLAEIVPGNEAFGLFGAVAGHSKEGEEKVKIFKEAFKDIAKDYPHKKVGVTVDKAIDAVLMHEMIHRYISKNREDRLKRYQEVLLPEVDKEIIKHNSELSEEQIEKITSLDYTPWVRMLEYTDEVATEAFTIKEFTKVPLDVAIQKAKEIASKTVPPGMPFQYDDFVKTFSGMKQKKRLSSPWNPLPKIDIDVIIKKNIEDYQLRFVGLSGILKESFSSKSPLLEDFFSRTIGTRSPQSDESGNRRLTVRGFMDIPGDGGYGIAIHPLDLKYLDGEDNDGDSNKVFFGADKKVIDHIEQPHIKHRFSRFFSSPAERDAFFKGDATKGLTIKQVLNRPDAQDILTGGKYLEDFAMEKGHTKELGLDTNPNLKRTYSMFSPTRLMEAGSNATNGKNNLGWGLANANRGRELGAYLRAWESAFAGKFPGTGGKFQGIEVDGGKYFLRAKPDKEEFNRTVWDIVNKCADAADGGSAPVDYETMRIVGGVLSVADVFDAKGKLVDNQEFINHMKKVGLSKVPILKELMEVDNNTKLREYDGTKKHLQDIFYNLRMAVDKAKDASGGVDLGSVWYRTAQFMSELKYDPEPLDFTNIVQSDMVRRQMDRLIKSNTPLAHFMLRGLGRAGVNFNNSYVAQTSIWKELVAMNKGKDIELLNDFINPLGKGSTYLNSKAWEMAGRMIDPLTRRPVNRQSELQSQLIATSTKGLVRDAKLWKDKRQVIWTMKDGTIRSEVFDSEKEAIEYKESQRPDGRVERVERTKGEQVKYIQELWQNDFKDMQSLSFMNDYLSKYLDTMLPKENLTDDAITDLLEKDIRPFAQTVNSLKEIAIKTQESFATNVSDRSTPGGKVLYKTLQEKRDAFQSWEEVMKKVVDYRASLEQPKKDLFDALWLSTLNWNEVDHTPEAMRLATKEGDVSQQNIEMYKDKLLREQKDRFDTYRGRTTMSMDIVDHAILKDFETKYAKLAGVMVEDKLSMETVAEAMNISELNGNLPHFTSRDLDFTNNNTRASLDKEARQNTAYFKHQFLEQFGKTREGDIADPKQRMEYKDYMTRYRKLLKDMPEQLMDLHTKFPGIMQEVYREPITWSPEHMTWQDFKLYVNHLEGSTYDPKSIARVKANWMFLRMPRIADAVERIQKEVTKYRIMWNQPVLTAEGAVARSPIERVFGSFKLMYEFQKHYREAKDADKQKSIELYDRAMPHNDAFNKEHNNIANKMVEIVNATEIEGYYAKMLTQEDGTKIPNVFEVNRSHAEESFKKLPQGPFKVIAANGETVSMNKTELRKYIHQGLLKYIAEYQSLLANRPHDSLVPYAEKEYGKNRIRLVDVEQTKKNLLQKSFELKGGQPDISIRAQLDIARAVKLEENLFDVYTTPEGIFFDSQMGKEQREAFDRGVKQNPRGYYAKLGKRFHEMTNAEQDAVMDQLYPDGNIMGVSNKDYDIYGDHYLHHMTLNRKTVTEYYKRMYEPLLRNLPPEEVKNLTNRMMEEIARTVNQEDDLNGGQEFMGQLFDKSNPLRSLSILPNKIFGGRNMNDPIPDWEMGINASITAHEILLKTQHDMQFALMSHFVVNDARKRSAFGPTEGGEHMINWLERYARQTMGFQDTTPPELAQGYNYGLKTNWMKFYNNKFWNDKITAIGDSWFGKKIFPEYAQVAAVAENLTFVKEKKKRNEMTDAERQWYDNENIKLRKQWIDQTKKNLSDKKISWLSQAEAKWSLMSLLTSLKTAVTNVTSAEVMTFMNAGASAYIRSFRLKDMQAEFGKDVIRNRGDVRTILQNLGGLESFFYNEAGMDPSMRKSTVAAVTEIMRQASQNEWKDVQIRQTFKDAGLMDVLVNRASWFMRSSERVARERSMLAHYINARRVFRQAGFELEYDDPWIMQIAREGVKASQFLYSNGERPEFMSTPMGKIFHRFQLYAYNSVEFRINAINAAQMTGIGPGSDDRNRFNRMMAADLFMFGMASLVPYSMFGSSLQAPYNGLQSSLKYMFGTDDEKRRSFFSALPYPANIIQPIVPPGLREIPQLFGLFVPGPGGVSQKLEDMVVTALPFQRIGKDIGKTIANPTMIIDNLTGIPFLKIPQVSRDLSNITTFNQYIDRYRDRASLENKKIKTDIEKYQYPLP